MDALEEIRDGNHVHLNINARDVRLKISDQTRQAQSEWGGAKLSAKFTVKGLHKVFKGFFE